MAAEPSNYGHVYRLNRDHVLGPAVLSALAAREEFLRRLTESTRALRPAVASAALFGSVARRESGPASDVDLLLVVQDDLDVEGPGWQDQVRALQSAVLAWSGNRLEMITVTRSHLNELVADDEAIVGSWRGEALTLAGSDLRRVVDRSATRARRAAVEA